MRLKLLIFLLLVASISHAQKYIFDVEVSGIGNQDILLLPCYGCSGELWDETVEELKSKYRCHVITMPGFAGVDPVEPPLYTKITEEVYRYVKTEGLNKPVAIGHSIGAHQALYVESSHPGTFSKIVVVDALPFLAADDNPDITPDSLDINAESIANFYDNINRSRYEDMAEKNTKSMIENKSKVDEIVSWVMNSDPYSYGYLYGEFMKIDLRQEMAYIDCPVLLLSAKGFGEKETKQVWRRQYKLLKDKRLEYNPNANHYIMYDDFDWMMKHIRDFLK